MVDSYSSDYISVSEAAKKFRITRQAIYHAIKIGKIETIKSLDSWKVSLSSIKSYRKKRYNRSTTMIDGKLLYDNSKHLYSAAQLAKILKVHHQMIYYYIKNKDLPYFRHGKASIVIHCDDFEHFKKLYCTKKNHAKNK
jgi:predicted DNA-binding protein YlxM (UPF0122 family)